MKSNANELEINLVFGKEELGVFLTRVSMVPILLAHSALTHCLSDLHFEVSVQVVGSPIKTGSQGDQREGQVLQKERKIRRAVSH